MAYLATSSSACPEVFRCGNRTFEYPFGAKSSGCGDPALQLECDRKVNMISLTINGYQYYLLRPFGHRKEFPIKYMTIVDRNIWGDACDPSTSNHTMEFWSSPQFRISDEYMNISLWGECSEDIREYQPTELYVLECNKTWYYSEWNLDTYCKSLVHLPAQKLGRSNRPLLGSIYNGFPIKWDFSKGCEHCESKKELCIYDISNSTQLSCKGGSDTAKRTAIALGCSVGGVALMAALALLCILYVKRKRRAHTRELRGYYSIYQRSGMEAGYPTYKIGSLSIFPYQELHQATNFFDEENLLGDGGFGVVYLGKLNDGRAVAVKRLYQDSCRTVEQFLNEVQILSSLSHPNLVRLYGCTSPQSPMLLLVYEFVPNGTLSDHLHGSRRTLIGLPWATRLNIAIETAQALALGVVLMEIISAKVAVDTMRNRNEISLANMATDKIRRGVLDELVDPDLKIGRNHEVKVTVAAVAELGFACLAIERDFRPTMEEVVARLTEIKEMLQESTETSNFISESPTSSLISLQENCPA
ncbi:hypothetical protein SUGI_0116150 [Cryptomeria japonica]|nr:hypothetical protein SUGI_0116150 [Cryptomeria japonica]